MELTWYWEYELQVFDVDEDALVARAGVVAADTMTKAMQCLEDYYGTDIEELHLLKPIMDGVYEFDYAKENGGSNYVITKLGD